MADDVREMAAIEAYEAKRMRVIERRMAEQIHAAVVLAIHWARLPPGMSLPHCIEVRRIMKTAVAEAMRTIDATPSSPA